MATLESDLQLARAVAAGDAEASQRLFQRLQVVLQRKAERFAWGNADDFVGDALSTAFGTIHNYRGQSSLEAWATGVLRNVVRKEARRRRIVRGAETRHAEEKGIQYESRLDCGEEQKEQLSKLELLAAEIPKTEWRECWSLQHAGRSQEEIGQELGTSVKNVERWLSQARAWMENNYLEAERAAVEEVIERGLALSRVGQLGASRQKLSVAAQALAKRGEDLWVWRWRARIWQRLAWNGMVAGDGQLRQSLAMVEAARTTLAAMPGEADEAMATEVIGLTIQTQFGDLEGARARWRSIREQARGQKLTLRGLIQAAMADTLMGVTEGIAAEEKLPLGQDLVGRSIGAFEAIGADVDRCVATIRLAELLAVGGKLDRAEKLLDAAAKGIPEDYASAQALLWYGRQLLCVYQKDDSGYAAAEQMVLKYARQWELDGYLTKLEHRRVLRAEFNDREIVGSSAARLLVRSKF